MKQQSLLNKIMKVMSNIISNKRNNNLVPPEMKADSFNKHFSKIGLSLASQHQDVPLQWKHLENTHTFKCKSSASELVKHNKVGYRVQVIKMF